MEAGFTSDSGAVGVLSNGVGAVLPQQVSETCGGGLMSSFAVRFESVDKGFSYWTEKHQSIKTWLVEMTRGRFSSGRRARIEVLRNVSFDIQQGEFVAIMGRNGAGKSTTLKLISGIYQPDRGRIQVNGNIAPLIELGAGFDAELSGYENILLSAAILGYSRKDALRSIDSIIDFSELGDLIEMPIKNYSSGMLVRLGFSVATQYWAPILLIDEVLGVGDMGFQEKSVRKIRDLHREGRTIILVTHSPQQAIDHAQRTIVIDSGTKVFDGASQQGTQVYVDRMSGGS